MTTGDASRDRELVGDLVGRGPGSEAGRSPSSVELGIRHGAVGLPAAWDAARGTGVVIAVLDTGVDLDHPGLEPNLVDGRDFIDDDARPDDPNGHGTHVAGIVATNGR